MLKSQFFLEDFVGFPPLCSDVEMCKKVWNQPEMGFSACLKYFLSFKIY